MAKRATVGVTGPDRGGFMAWLMTALAIRRCGARAVRIQPSQTVDRGLLDAVVIGGGSDVDPLHYGEESLKEDFTDTRHSTALDWLVGLVLSVFRAIFARHSIQGYDRARDSMEQDIIRHALQRDLPVLGICRGAQLMNVSLGGSLHQDIGHFYTEDTNNVRSILPRKKIDVTDDSRLRRMLDTPSCYVNALHNQSIKRLGENVIVSAREPNGVIQAIEKQDHRFFIGVQWHPEYMPQSKTQQNLFRGLIQSVASYSPGQGQ
jgi:putative glutamine amidotransferase